MPHAFNRRAFGSVARGPLDGEGEDSAPLLALYCALVRLELALKDHKHSFYGLGGKKGKGHDVCGMLRDVEVTDALIVQLDNRLVSLCCTMRDGTSGTVDPKNYPHLRYLRHETDFPGTSTNEDLRGALDVLRDIERELEHKRISL